LPELPNCTYLRCSYNKLENLPKLPKCTALSCSDNHLKSLPELPSCTDLNCSYNKLKSLPELPSCTDLNCSYNKLKSLPELPICTHINCFNNKLTNLSNMPSCTHLDCFHNQLPFTEPSKWKVIWRMRNIYYSKKYFRLWYRRTLEKKAHKKYDLHLELRYSPNLKFYLEDEYCKHFKECQMQYKLTY
jgi:hypothetical protein